MGFLRRQVPLILVFMMGLVFIVQYFVPHQWSQDMQAWVNKWLMIIGSISLLLGIGSLIHFHYTKISRKAGGWGYSGVMFAAFILSIIAGFSPSIMNKLSPLPKPLKEAKQPETEAVPPSLQILYPNGGELLIADETTKIQWIKKGPVSALKIEISGDGLSGPWEIITDTVAAAAGAYTWTVTAPISPTCYVRITSLEDASVWDASDGSFKIDKQMVWYRTSGVEEGGPLDWLFMNMINPMGATMFAIIGFFIASAAFRAFRARSLEATLLLVAATIIMLGQTPLGGIIWSGIPDIMTWILTIPNTAAKRAILFGIALGSIAFSLRIILGIERGYLGGADKT